MYVLKNAFLNVFRTKGRSLLIGIIIFAISVSSCIGLSIRQAAETAKEDSLKELNITAQISVNRKKLMDSAGSSGDKSAMRDAMAGAGQLSLEDMEKYAEAPSVKAFNYSTTLSLNADNNLSAVGSSDSEGTDANSSASISTSGKGMGGSFSRVQGDFSIIGYSSYDSMTAFENGTAAITEGELFEEGNADLKCIISEELAAYNMISVGDNIILTNPNKEDETYELTVCGIYSNSQSGTADEGSIKGFSTSTDPANHIYMSYAAAKAIEDASISDADVETDLASGVQTTTAISSQTSGSYIFATIEDYNKFQEEAAELGLSDSYTVSSSDVTSYEQGLIPLNNLSRMAGYFLIVVVGIGAVVLVILNIFSIRERKYEVGVLTAIGMKKRKVAAQFIIEILIISVLSVGIGGAVGAASSVPVTNSLLASQVAEVQEEASSQMINGAVSMNKGSGYFRRTNVSYITSVSSAVNLTVLLQLLGIFILLTVVSGMVSVIFIMRYEPLKILSNRD